MTERIGLQAVLEMSDFTAGVNAYNSGIDAMLAGGDDLSSSAKSQLVALTDLAQVLSNASPAKLAATAIDQLKQQFAEGSITASQYAAAVTQVQDEFGLVSPTGKAAAGALTELNAKFQAGEISAEEYAAGLKAVDVSQDSAGKSAVELAAQMQIVEKVYSEIKNVIGQAIELAELGAQAERAEKRFTAFANEVGNADDLLAAFQRGAGGTVDKMTAMSSAAKLLQMGLVKTDSEMETVVEIATRLGDQTASAGDRVADFALLLANQSIPRLDNFGISSGRVRDRIEELIKTGQAVGREDAFKMAVFEEGAKSLDILGERTVDAGAKMEKARAKIADLKVELAQGLLPVVGNAFEVIGNLNSGTLALIATLGGGAGAAIKFSGGLGGLAEKLGASTLQMGALAAGIAALVVAVEVYQDTMADMGTAQDAASTAAASLGEQFKKLVDDGATFSEAVTEVQTAINDATSAYNNNIVTGTALGNLFGTDAAMAGNMSDALQGVNAELIASSTSYDDYIAKVNAFNAGLTDSNFQLTASVESNVKSKIAAQEYAASLEGLTVSQRALLDEITLGSSALARSRGEVETHTLAEWDFIAAQEAQKVALGENLTAFDQHNRALHSSTEASGAATAKAGELVDARRLANSMVEKAAAVEDMQATSALASAAALEQKRQKDIETVQAEQDLAQSVMNASDAMIAQTFISGLDPDAMGLTAYREAVENIQLSFGLATPESIALSRGITQGIEAANAGQLAYKDLDAFILALREDAADGNVDFDNLAHAFASSSQESAWLTENIAKTGDAMVNNVAQAEDLIAAEEGLDTSNKQYRDQLLNTSGVLANVADSTEMWTDTVSGTERVLSSTQTTTEQWASKMQGLDNKLLATGEDLLAVDDKVQALNAVLERTDTAGTAAATGLDTVKESAGQAALGLEETTTSVGGLETAMSDAAAAAPGYGSAIGSGLRAGMEPQMDGFVASFRDKLQSIKDQLPSSEPKNVTSPLRGLGKSGEAIINNITKGIDVAGPSAVSAIQFWGTKITGRLDESIGDIGEGIGKKLLNTDDLFSAANTLSGMGGAAGGLFQKRVLDPLIEIDKGYATGLDEIEKSMEKQETIIAKAESSLSDWELRYTRGVIEILGREKGTQELRRILNDDEFERVMQLLSAEDELGRLAERRNSIQEKSIANFKILTAEQERLDKLQTQQENLSFLKQQMELLEWIASKGLDAREILGDLQLGIGADAGDMVDAMARALEIVVAQADIDEDRLDIMREMAEEQERMNRLQQQEENLSFIERQAHLLDLIAEHGLDAADVLDGLQLGLEANAGDVMEAMTRAMALIVAQAEEELGIASPSRVFEKIGEQTMSGMALGIERLMNLPVAQSALAAQEMIAAPAAIVSPRNTTIDNSRTMGDVNVNAGAAGGQMNEMRLASLIRQVVHDEMRGR